MSIIKTSALGLTADATNLVKISSQTISSGTASVEFTSGIDSTYKLYKFEFISVHPATDDVDFGFSLSTDGGSNYNLAKTGSGHQMQGAEDGGHFASATESVLNSAQVTGRTPLSHSTGNGADEQFSGHMFLYNPSSTTFTKSYLSFIQNYFRGDIALMHIVQGYANTTSDIDAVKFEFSSGNIDAGTFTMYGVKT
tara:strand:+ start:923 stop:1510 length:588 start_codon:yes stop_codon:yes gene_type:complete